MAWKSWDVYVVKDGETVHRGVTGGVSRQSARELASTLFNIAKDKLMLVPKGSAGRKKRAATPNRFVVDEIAPPGRRSHSTKRAGTRTYKIGQTVHLPDGPSGKLVRIAEGVEFGDPVYYLTVVNSLGQEVTRWVPR